MSNSSTSRYDNENPGAIWIANNDLGREVPPLKQ
jgi:hypothetical protein